MTMEKMETTNDIVCYIVLFNGDLRFVGSA